MLTAVQQRSFERYGMSVQDLIKKSIAEGKLLKEVAEMLSVKDSYMKYYTRHIEIDGFLTRRVRAISGMTIPEFVYDRRKKGKKEKDICIEIGCCPSSFGKLKRQYNISNEFMVSPKSFVYRGETGTLKYHCERFGVSANYAKKLRCQLKISYPDAIDIVIAKKQRK